MLLLNRRKPSNGGFVPFRVTIELRKEPSSLFSHQEPCLLLTQSDYSRAQHTEKYIQDRVAAELAKLERETLKKFKDTTDKSLETSSYEGPSVSGANDKIADLTKRLQDNISKAKVQTSDEFNSAREQVIKCLRDNEGRSLNCWDEVQQFRKLANEL